MPHSLPLYIRPSRSQEVFGVSRSTVYRWASQGLITIRKRGTMSFVEVAELRRVIEDDTPSP